MTAKEVIVKAVTRHEIRTMYRKIEREERHRKEEASFEQLDHCIKVFSRAIDEAKRADTYKDGLWWLAMAQRYSIRCKKIRTELEKGSR